MNLPPWYDVLRGLTSIGALICMYLSGRRFIKVGHTFTPRMKDIWWTLNAFLFATFEGSIEQILGLRVYGPRVVLVFLIIAVFLRSNWRRRGEGYIKPGYEEEQKP